MASYRYFTIDTNFFIAGFGENPKTYEKLDRILNKLRIKISIPNYVDKEFRWYMRREIGQFLKVENISPKELEKFMVSARKRVDIKLPQPPDCAVALLAEKQDYGLVSSDLRLVEIAQQLGLTAMMNSAFLLLLLQEVKDTVDRDYLQNLYEKLFADEISYSVQSSNRYDPVIRIQKIMDSAISVIKKQRELVKEKPLVVNEEYNFPEYLELIEITKQVRTDLSDFLKMMEMGNYKALTYELQHDSQKLIDLSSEVRMLGVTEEDPVYRETITTLAHVYILQTSLAIGEHRLHDAKSISDQLLLIMLENKDVEERLDMEIHLQRITIFFLTEQLDRFRLYYSPAFVELCHKRERGDILALHRVMAIIIAALSLNKAEPSAIAKDFLEIEYIIQLGVQFISVEKIQEAWLLLEQAVWMSINSNMMGLLFAVFEILIPLSFKTDYVFSPSFEDLMAIVKNKFKDLPFDEYSRRSTRNENVDERLLRKRSTKHSKLPLEFQGFLDVISTDYADFKNIGRSTFVRVIDWQTMHFIGIVDPTMSLNDTLTVGSSVKILQGSFRVIEPSVSIKKNRGIDLILIAKPDNLKFIVRRAQQVSLVQSKVLEYDL
jgi:predicted nucleic acid-binding protein